MTTGAMLPPGDGGCIAELGAWHVLCVYATVKARKRKRTKRIAKGNQFGSFYAAIRAHNADDLNKSPAMENNVWVRIICAQAGTITHVVGVPAAPRCTSAV